jgi:hypothetical protein
MAKRIILILLVTCPIVLSAENLGDYYYAKQHYFEAITEYKRQLFLGKYESEDEILLKMVNAYRAGKQDLDAEEMLLQAIYNDETSAWDRQCYVELARLHWDKYNYVQMRYVLDYLAGDLTEEGHDRINYIKAWTYFYEANWDEGFAFLDSVQFIDSEKLREDIAGVHDVPQKSRTLAVVMSNVIPGTGHLYARDYPNALYSSLLVGGTMASIISNLIDQAYFVSFIKFLFIYTRYTNGTLIHLAKKVDSDNIDALGNYLKTVSQKYPAPLDVLEQLR